MKVSEALEAARALMNDGGRHWNKHGYFGINDDGEKTYCSLGALGTIVPDGQLWIDCKRLLKRHLPDGTNIANFNDSEDTVWEDVDTLFKRAIAAAEAEEVATNG